MYVVDDDVVVVDDDDDDDKHSTYKYPSLLLISIHRFYTSIYPSICYSYLIVDITCFIIISRKTTLTSGLHLIRKKNYLKKDLKLYLF